MEILFEFSLAVKCDCGVENVLDQNSEFNLGYLEDHTDLVFLCDNCGEILGIPIEDLFNREVIMMP